MAYQSLNLGSTGDDGTGDSMRAGGDKINDNFSEIYTLLGTGTALTTGMSATGSVVTLTAATIATAVVHVATIAVTMVAAANAVAMALLLAVVAIVTAATTTPAPL